MQRILSTYLFVSKKLTPELLTVIHQNKFQAVEVFASRHHFDYANRAEVRSLAQSLADNRLILNSLHAPTNRDVALNREGGTPLSITEVERVRRIEAMDELRRVIDVAEDLPFSRLIVHMGGSRETADPRKRDAAFSTLEHLSLHAKHVGVTICIENTASEMGAPAYLKTFLDETRLSVRINFDIGHAHLLDGAEDERVARGFEVLKDAVLSTHIHDNHGEKDEHLLPYDGTIDWAAALKMFREAPVKDLPLTLEIKEKSGPDAPGVTEQIAAVAKGADRLEEAWFDS
jgi:sugar phosphate isomerase/epimerase